MFSVLGLFLSDGFFMLPLKKAHAREKMKEKEDRKTDRKTDRKKER